MSEIWRLFIAIELPAPVTHYLAEIQDTLKSRAPRRAIRWVAPESVHLTLKFLGDVPAAYQAAIHERLEQAVEGHAPFELAAGEIGCFPSPQRPRVIWTGVHQETPALHALRDSVEEHIAPLGYPTETRPYHPHLTLGRVRRNINRSTAQQIGKLIRENNFKARRRWTVQQVTLFRSELTPQGAIYTPLSHAALPPAE